MLLWIKITLEQYKEKGRQERYKQFSTVDYIIERYNEQKLIGGVETNEQEYISTLKYKQYLRDIPQQETFPFEEVINFDNWSKI